MMDSFNNEAACFTIEEVFDLTSYYMTMSITVSGIQRAVLENNLEATKCLVDMGESLNAKEECEECIPLHLAVLKNRVEILGDLLSRDDNELNARCVHRITPRCTACKLDTYVLVKELINAGAYVSMSDTDDVSPLYLRTENLEICHLFILHGAIIDAVDENGLTPLFNAVLWNHFETVDMLLYYNADPNIPDNRGMTPFIQMLIWGRVEAQKVLLEYVDDFNVSYSDDVDSGTLIELALENGSPLVVELMERGADVNKCNDSGYCGAFSKCVVGMNDSTVFKVVWERLRCYKSVDLCGLFDDLDGDLLASYIQVIIDSDNVGLAVESFTWHDNFHVFVGNFLNAGLEVGQLVVFTYRLLEYGYRPNLKDVHNVLYEYGDGELSRVLLYMDIDCSYTQRFYPESNSFLRAIVDLDFDARVLKHGVDSGRFQLTNSEVVSYLGHFRDPCLVGVFRSKFVDDEDLSEILNGLSKVPSLVELARDHARKYIRERFKVTNMCRFYTTIDYLDIPSFYKDILTYNRKIYGVKR